MADIKYTIEFFSDWHCGSGLAAGAAVDALVVKDSNNLPFVPGKTIKGLIREALENIISFEGNIEENQKINEAFGFFQDSEHLQKGSLFFSNAELQMAENERAQICALWQYMYRTIASTSIDEFGIAKGHSLRKIEVAVPCKLEGVILNVPDDLQEDILRAMKFIKRIGTNRNRGLGRCQIVGKIE